MIFIYFFSGNKRRSLPVRKPSKKPAPEERFDSDIEDPDELKEDPIEDPDDDDDYGGPSSGLPVGGKEALSFMNKGDDPLGKHPSWVKIPVPDLENQRSQLRNHIAVRALNMSFNSR